MSFSDLKSSENLRGDRLRDDRSVGFGRYRIFPALRLLLRDGDKVDLGPRAFDVLWTLFEAGGELVSKDELIDKVWPAWRSRRTTSRPRCLRLGKL